MEPTNGPPGFSDPGCGTRSSHVDVGIGVKRSDRDYFGVYFGLASLSWTHEDL